MALISLRDLGLVTPRPLFHNLTVSFGSGDRVGLVAGNGAGKSTLLRCVAGQVEPDTGSVVLSRGASLGFVEQEVPSGLLALTLEEVFRRALPAAERRLEEWRVVPCWTSLAPPRHCTAGRSERSSAAGSGWPSSF